MVWYYAPAANNHIYLPSANKHGLSAMTLARVEAPAEVYSNPAISTINSLRSTGRPWLEQGSESCPPDARLGVLACLFKSIISLAIGG